MTIKKPFLSLNTNIKNVYNVSIYNISKIWKVSALSSRVIFQKPKKVTFWPILTTRAGNQKQFWHFQLPCYFHNRFFCKTIKFLIGVINSSEDISDSVNGNRHTHTNTRTRDILLGPISPNYLGQNRYIFSLSRASLDSILWNFPLLRQ